jgi:hypothetical protein
MGHTTMFSLFRPKIKRRSSGSRAQKQSAPRQKIDSGQYEKPSLEGYAVQELEVSQFPRSVQSAELTPEQLRSFGERIR